MEIWKVLEVCKSGGRDLEVWGHVVGVKIKRYGGMEAHCR